MKRWVLVALLLLLVPIAVGGWFLAALERPFKSYGEPEVFVEIPQGSGSAAIGRRLAEAGVVNDATTFRLAVWMRGAGQRLQAGEYRFDEPLSAKAVVDKLARGDVFLQPITFREGLTIRQMSELFESRGLGTAAEFVAAAGDGSLIRDLDPAAPDLEGYLFPDTYMLPRRTNAPQLVSRMVSNFKRAFSDDIKERSAAMGLNVRQLVTLASLVEKETGKEEERRTVAAVYWNRMRIGMGMQADPTVIYALEKAGRYDGNLTRENLRFDSPYNTYRYAGLPPGPIAAPGRASLEAAANPEDVPYIYFVSRNDGSHVFATTLEEHNRNVHQWQVLYFRERRNRE